MFYKKAFLDKIEANSLNTETQNMDDLKNHNNSFFKESIWEAAPLFAHNVEPQIENNKSVQNTDSTAIERKNAEPQTESNKKANPSSSTNLENAETENIVPSITTRPENLESSTKINVEPHNNENKTLLNSENSHKIQLPQSSKKKSRSQKRNVIPKKFFVLPEEEEILEKDAKGRGISFSNYIRFLIGLNLNEKGRKKRNVTAAFDLDDLHLDE